MAAQFILMLLTQTQEVIMKTDTIISKDAFVQLLKDVGISEVQMTRLHALFEERLPEAHQRFLEALGIPQAEIQKIREQA